MRNDDPRIDALIALLERHRAALQQAYAGVPTALLDAIPGPDLWSVGQVLEHLWATEQGITRLISNMLSETAVRPAEAPYDRDTFVRSLDMPFFLDRSRKVKGRQPPGEVRAAEAWTALQVSRTELLSVLEQARGRRLEDYKRPHPARGEPLDGYEWIAFLALHERRHAAQIEEITAVLREQLPEDGRAAAPEAP